MIDGIISPLPLEWEFPLVLASYIYGFLFLCFFPMYVALSGSFWKGLLRALAIFGPFWVAAVFYWHHSLKGLFQ